MTSQLLDPDTAPETKSIWNAIDRRKLEQNTQELNRRQYVPGPIHYAQAGGVQSDPAYPLPLEIERSIADDLAFVAAYKPQVEFVSAVAVEQSAMVPSLVIKLAANEGISPEAREMFDRLLEVLKQKVRKDVTRETCQTRLFDCVLQLNCNKILGRLGSSKFKPPPHLRAVHREPLPRRIRSLFRGIKTKSTSRQELSRLDQQISGFEMAFNRLESGSAKDAILNIALVVKEAFALTEDGVKLPARLKALGCSQSLIDARDVREVGKVSKYWTIARHLTICSEKFGAHFANLRCHYLPKYKASTTSPSRLQQFVHAEIQILVHYEMTTPELVPRVIGASKAACFLCDSMIKSHGRFSVTAAHRQVYPQWTVPDLAEYSPETIQHLRSALKQTYADVCKAHAKARRKSRGLPVPPQSAINLNATRLTTPAESSLSLKAVCEPSSADNTAESDRPPIVSEAESTQLVTVSDAKSVNPSIASDENSLHSPIASDAKSVHLPIASDEEPVHLPVVSEPLIGERETIICEHDQAEDTLVASDSEDRAVTDPEHPDTGDHVEARLETPLVIAVSDAVAGHALQHRLFASFSNAPFRDLLSSQQQQCYARGSITLEPVVENERRRTVRVTDVPLEDELVVARGPDDAPQELSFVLTHSRDPAIRVRCRWHDADHELSP